MGYGKVQKSGGGKAGAAPLEPWSEGAIPRGRNTARRRRANLDVVEEAPVVLVADHEVLADEEEELVERRLWPRGRGNAGEATEARAEEEDEEERLVGDRGRQHVVPRGARADADIRLRRVDGHAPVEDGPDHDLQACARRAPAHA